MPCNHNIHNKNYNFNMYNKLQKYGISDLLKYDIVNKKINLRK